jgi:hypothetical protein
MTDTIETQFIVNQENILERSPYFYKYSRFNIQALPILSEIIGISSLLFLWNTRNAIVHFYGEHDYAQLFLLFIIFIVLFVLICNRSLTKAINLHTWRQTLFNEYKTTFVLSEQCITILVSSDRQEKTATYQAMHGFKRYSVYSFAFVNNVEASEHFIYLRHYRPFKLNTLTICLKKDAITYADFQRLQEAIPCLQGLSVDPQQFKQDASTNE